MLLPRKDIFQLHFSLISLWLGMYLTGLLLSAFVKTRLTTEKEEDIYNGLFWLVVWIWDLIEESSFFLLIYLMLPVTDSAKKCRTDMNRFLFDGFVNLEKLEEAVIAQNPSMTVSQRGFVRNDLG